MIEKDEVTRYMNKLKTEINEKMTIKRRPSIDSKAK